MQPALESVPPTSTAAAPHAATPDAEFVSSRPPAAPEPGPALPEPKPAAAPALRRGLSIFQKLLILILLLVVGIVVLLAVYFPARQISSMQSALEAKAQTYGRLVSKQVESAIAFDDQETAREVFESVAQDADIDSLTLFTANGSVLRARGSMSPELESKKTGVTAQQLIVSPERLAVVAPVVSLEGPRGTLILEVSQRRLIEQRRAVQRDAAIAGLLALLVGALGASSIAVSLGRRLRAIARAADAVAGGDLNQKPVEVKGSLDEIGTVSVAFNAMLGQIRGLVAQIRKSAQEEQERLEGQVRERTRELDARNADMRRVLDNVGQGFFTLDRTTKMSRERSAVVDRWLGEPPASESFVDLLATIAPDTAEWFKMGWESLLDDLLPAEVCLDQLPKRLTVRELELEIDYRAILAADGSLERVLVVVSDVTAVLLRQRAEADEREVTRLIARVISDRAGFLEFFTEAHGLVEAVSRHAESKNTTLLQRSLHTLKGNTAIYGIETVAGIAHSLEDRLAEASELNHEDVARLRQRWTGLAHKIHALVGDQSVKIEIDDVEYRQILEAIEHGRPRREIRHMVEAWRLEPTQTRLSRLAEQASSLATRLGKGPIDVRVASNQIRLKAEEWSQFWGAAVHVLRNSIDHGLETPDERSAAGKSLPAKLELKTTIDSERFCIEFSDDGRGIDWEAVRRKAEQLGLPSNTREQLCAALFADGLSTRDRVSDMSGRGVGLGAVREACQKLGGTVEVQSRPGAGTTFRFVWPSHVINGAPVAAGLPSKPPLSISVGLRWASIPPIAE